VASTGSPVPTFVAWTSDGSLYCSRMDRAIPAASRCDTLLRPLGFVPRAHRRKHGGVCWWSRGPLTVGAVVGPSGDRLCVQASQGWTKPSRWTCAADLRDLWESGRHASSSARLGPGRSEWSRGLPAVACAILLQVRHTSWLVLGLLESGGRTSICAIAAGGAASAPRRLQLPGGFSKPTCLTALSPRFLACGDSQGLVCWWTQPDFSFAGQSQPICHAAVVSLTRIWSLQLHDDTLAPEPSLVAALDELGKCRILDLVSGDLLCLLQSQSGVSLWIDEPLRIIHDTAGRYVCVATPAGSWVWDSASGSFEGSVGDAAGQEGEASSPAGRREPGPPASGSGGSLVAMPSSRWSSLRSPGFGVDSVVWQVPSLSLAADAALAHPAAGASLPAAPKPAWWLGEVMLDGPIWRLPVALVSPANLLAGATGSDVGQLSEASEARSTAAASGCRPPREGMVLSDTSCCCMPWPFGDNAPDVEAQLASLGVHLPEPPFLVGALGVDDSPSFPLPRRRGLAVRSLPPARRRRGTQERQWTPSATSSSRELLHILSAQRSAQGAQAGDCAPADGSARGLAQAVAEDPGERAALPPSIPEQWPADISLAFVARLLLHAESPQPVLQWCAIPAVRCILNGAAALPAIGSLAAWVDALRPNPKAETAVDTALRYGAFGSAAGLRDAATIVLALVAHLQPRLLERRCLPPVASLIAESLCARMLSRASGVQLQSLCCEVLAMAFPFWRRYMTGAMSKHPLAGVGRGASAAIGPRQGDPGSGARGGGKGAPADQSYGGADEGAGDECLEWTAVHMLTVYQEPRVAASSLAVLMQVGVADPATLLQVMGRAARRLDLGAAFTSSALFVLVAFIQRYAGKVLPLLSKFTEAVLQCLEPSDPSLRRQSLLAVTSALHELVQTFPMVAFHQQSQKFAVGTGDGLVVVYDLRTATKWRILEGHAAAVAALAFSRDGSQLSSYSAHDRSVRLWQCRPTGFLGGILGTSGRCLKRHVLPPLPAPPASAGLGGGGAAVDAAVGGGWRTVSLAWMDAGVLSLVRENGETVQIPLDGI